METLTEKLSYLRKLAAERTQGDFKHVHFPHCELKDGTLFPTDQWKRAIHARWHDDQGRRCTQYIAEVFEQAAGEDQGRANGDYFAAAPLMMQVIDELTRRLEVAYTGIVGSDVYGGRRAAVKALDACDLEKPLDA